MKKMTAAVAGAIIFTALLAFTAGDKKRLKIFLAGDSTMSVKEIRAYPETGWGMPFVFFWDSTVTVDNRAKNGRSTRTFISEGLWNKLVSDIKEGDYVFIQFGHNDESKEKADRYTTPQEFRANLANFVAETRKKKAIPVLLSPVSRRKFDKDNKAVFTHGEYPAIVKQLAAEQQVVFIDLDTMSLELYQQLGPEASRLLFLQLQPGEHPNYPEGKTDNTHFSELGARLVAQLVLKEIRLQLPELASRIVQPAAKN